MIKPVFVIEKRIRHFSLPKGWGEKRPDVEETCPQAIADRSLPAS
jgi:hypothetical protein